MTHPCLPPAARSAAATAALFLLSLGAGCQAPAVRPPPQSVRASDGRFVYEGRFDFADRSAPVAIWQGSRIRIDFGGDALSLRFGEASDQCFFNATVDGRTSVVGLHSGAPPVGAAFSGLGAGRHSLVLFKRSEAAAGTVPFLGVDVARGAEVWAPAAPRHRLAMEFIGD